MSPRMTAQLACDVLQMALWRRRRPESVIVHTDRGGQYCSGDYQALLKRHNLRGSMSAKGYCYDNACVESFFHSLKVECIHGERFNSREIMRAGIIKQSRKSSASPRATFHPSLTLPCKYAIPPEHGDIFIAIVKLYNYC